MRVTVLLLLSLVLVGCRGTQPYTEQDLRQVKQVFSKLGPTYAAFKVAYRAHDLVGMRAALSQEQKECKKVDEIDARDTIDPTVELFQASYGLDSICNSIEMAYVIWAKKHHLPYDKRVFPSRPSQVFLGGNSAAKKMSKYFRHPEALASS
ncbi:MAG: hypothetical protein NVSMB52_05090 [Chloroflexota bacterium]